MLIWENLFLWSFRTWMIFCDIVHITNQSRFLEHEWISDVRKLIGRWKYARFSLSSTTEWLILLMALWPMIIYDLYADIFLIICLQQDKIMWFQKKSWLSGREKLCWLSAASDCSRCTPPWSKYKQNYFIDSIPPDLFHEMKWFYYGY
jgi:hypothetical protein